MSWGVSPWGLGSWSGIFAVPPPPPPVITLTDLSLFRKRSAETQLRIVPVNETPSDSPTPVGTIAVVAGVNLVDGDRFALNDLINPAVRFIYDSNASVVEEDNLRAIVFTPADTITQIRDNTIAAINGAPALNMAASVGGPALITLTDPSPGPEGKGTIVEVVVDPTFVVSLNPQDEFHVICLGDDLLTPPIEDYEIGDYVSFEQAVPLTAGTKLVKAQARFRQPANLPIRQLFPAGTFAVRSQRKRLQVVAGAQIIDGETFTLTDGVNPAVTYEFDSNDSFPLISQTATSRVVKFTGTEAVNILRDKILAAINNTPILNIDPGASGIGGIGLENSTNGFVIFGDTVADPAFVTTAVSDRAWLRTASPFFTAAQHTGRTVVVTGGFGVTPGPYTIAKVEAADRVILTSYPLVANGALPVGGYAGGAHWVARVFFESNLIFNYDPGRDGGRKRDLRLPDLSINVSKFAGVRMIKYEFLLVETV